MNIRWGFEEDDEWDDQNGDESTAVTDEPLTGQDRDHIVTVAVNDAAEVVWVSLARDWKSSVDPRGLHTNVLAAMNAATMHALAKQVEQIDMTGQPPVGTGTPSATSDHREELGDNTPITKEDAIRLVDAASADLERYLAQASAIIDVSVTTTSAGGHVSVSGRQRQVLDVSIDASWAGSVRYSEIESELLDALTSFSTQSSLGELAQGPQSSAITELMTLASDPQALVRRIRQSHQS
ncbi:MAG: hypothetical protein ACRDQW_13790 [Haloechinothrix sp.]